MEPWNIAAGELRHLVTIQQKAIGADDTRGHPARTWSDSIAKVPAKIQTPTGRKLELARQLVPTATHLIDMRFRVLDEENNRITYFSAVTTLNGGITSGAGTITVANAATIAVNTVLQIDAEQMLVTAVSGMTLTVTRAYNSTTAAAHLTAKPVLKRRIFNIGHQNDVEERRVKLVLTCTEVKGPSAA